MLKRTTLRRVHNPKTGGASYRLDEDQKNMLIQLYPITSNAELVTMLGVSYGTLYRLRRELGLVKDAAVAQQRRGKSLSKAYESERKRIEWGLPPRTRLHVSLDQWSRNHIDARRRMRKRGYIIGEPTGSNRMSIYYTAQTNRSARMERHASELHFTIEEYKP